MNRKSILILAVVFGLLTMSGIAYQIITKKSAPRRNDALTVLMPGTEISALYDDGERLWAGTGTGIFILDRNTGDITEKPDADIHMIFSAMV